MHIPGRFTFLFLLAAMMASAAEIPPAATPPTRRDQRQDRKSSVRPTRWVNPLRTTIEGAEHKTFRSTAMKCDVGFVIYTPPGYAAGDDHYPVIYWLHGRGANESSGTVAIQALHGLIVAKKVPPMMMVCPNGGDSSFYCDSPDGTVMAETAFIEELIPFVDKNYRTVASREGRALEGFSMGGFGVMKLGAKYPGLFCSLQTYGGALVDEQTMPVRHSGTFALMFGGKVELFRQSDPRVWMKKNADELRRSVKIRHVVGAKDPTRMENQPFDELLTQLRIPHEFETVPDIGHNPRLYYEQVGEKGFRFHAAAFAVAKSAPKAEAAKLL